MKLSLGDVALLPSRAPVAARSLWVPLIRMIDRVCLLYWTIEAYESSESGSLANLLVAVRTLRGVFARSARQDVLACLPGCQLLLTLVVQHQAQVGQEVVCTCSATPPQGVVPVYRSLFFGATGRLISMPSHTGSRQLLLGRTSADDR